MQLWAVLPELIVAVACLALVGVAGWVRGSGQRWPAALAAAAIVAAMIATARLLGSTPVAAFHGTYLVDLQAQRFKLLILLSALLTLGFCVHRFAGRAPQAHAPVALLFATLGAMGLCSSMDLGLILLFLQLSSMASYVLVALVREDAQAREAALKYFLFGAAALAVMAYGLTFLYGMSGSLDLRDLGRASRDADVVWLHVVLLLVLAGYGFKIGAVPLHFWAPDALGASAAPIGGFLSVVPKLGALAALARFLLEVLPSGRAAWPLVIAVLAAATMTYGNFAALRQRRLRRLLAYSTIAQAGYVLMAVAVLGRTDTAMPAMQFYLAAYLLMNLGAFAVAAALEREGDDLHALQGLARRSPWLAAALALSLLSLAGIPPLAGFAGKVLLLEAAYAGGMPWLAVTAALNMLIALAYYLRLLARMYFMELPLDRSSRLPAHGFVACGALVCCTGGTLLLGLFPGLWLPPF